MEKKIIIAISAFVGSNTPYLLGIVEFLIFYNKGIKTEFYSLDKCPVDCIIDKITASKNRIHIIDGLSSLQQIDAIEQRLNISYGEDLGAYVFKPIGIEVPPDDCFLFLQLQDLVSKTISYIEWRQQNEQDEYRIAVQQCHKKIGTINDYIYLCQEFDSNTQMGKLTDEILLLI